jgi:hypothetical protein
MLTATHKSASVINLQQTGNTSMKNTTQYATYTMIATTNLQHKFQLLTVLILSSTMDQ